jgi:hypothetical protein
MNTLDRPLTIEGRNPSERERGSAFGSQSGPKPEDVLCAADEAMHRAKASAEA